MRLVALVHFNRLRILHCRIKPNNISITFAYECRFIVYIFLHFTSLHFTSFSQTSSRGNCRVFTKNSLSLTVLSYSSYSSPFNSFFQNLLHPFFPSMSASLFGSLSPSASLPGLFGIYIILHSYNVPTQYQLS